MVAANSGRSRVCGYVGQDEILRAVVNRAIQAAAIPDKRVTNPLQVVNLPHSRAADRPW